MRLFAGIRLPDALRQDLARLGSGLPGARWVALENLHVTLRFIGEVSFAEAEDVDAALAAIRGSGFDLTFRGIDNFGSGHKVRSLWAALAPSAGLVQLRDKVESAIVRAGFDPEGRKFTPHVTLARLRKSPAAQIAAYIEAMGGLATQSFAVGHFTLFESILGRGGADYRPIADYPLESPMGGD